MNELTAKLDFSSVEETALLTLYARAIESQSQDPILRDKKAEELVKQLDPLLKERDTKMARQLLNRSIDPTGVLTCGKPYTQGISLVGEDTNENFNQFELPFLHQLQLGTILQRLRQMHLSDRL
ncbi:MAG: hypothetical protein P1S60_10625 [Anaerolineae bacterium]|nr:hypothetical protein [Anaerolineae bacterium]